MKPALRWLPSEVWMDILCFPWISRQKLGKLVDKIGNRQFAEFLQEYLHKWGKRTLKCVLLCQHFHAAKTLRTFAVQFLLDDNWKPIPDFHLENALGEQLHGQEIAVRDFQISRHRANAGKGLQEWVENVAEKSRQGYIEISPEMSIGRIRAITANGNNGNKEDGPSTSKRRKLAA